MDDAEKRGWNRAIDCILGDDIDSVRVRCAKALRERDDARAENARLRTVVDGVEAMWQRMGRSGFYDAYLVKGHVMDELGGYLDLATLQVEDKHPGAEVGASVQRYVGCPQCPGIMQIHSETGEGLCGSCGYVQEPLDE